MESIIDTLAIMLDTVKLAVASALDVLVRAPVDTSALRSSTLATVLSEEVIYI